MRQSLLIRYAGFLCAILSNDQISGICQGGPKTVEQLALGIETKRQRQRCR